MDKRFLIIMSAIVVLFIGYFAFSQSSNSKSSSSGSSSGQPTNHIQGENQKNVTVMEYGDYQCPVCEAYYLPLKQATAKYTKEVHFQFRNLPLSAIHQNAFAAARAAEAAGLQNKYWEMHDKLYENQNQWVGSTSPIDTFTTYAKQIGINTNQFKTDYTSAKVNDYINADLNEFGKTGKDKSTPTIFINGTYIPNANLVDSQTGAPTAEKIGTVIQAAIDKNSKSSQ